MKWSDTVTTPGKIERFAAVVNDSACDLPIFWGYDQTAHTTIRLHTNIKHYLLMETPYYAARIPKVDRFYGKVIRPEGYVSLGFDGLQGRAIQWKGMPPTR